MQSKPKGGLKAVGYLRVSTMAQAQKGEPINTQKEAIEYHLLFQEVNLLWVKSLRFVPAIHGYY
ncbi:MAG TPA: hypothetical protein VJ917_10480 [Saprospiraceae bacterium]|nr:hypothetical protein [Saprospiraceae bacterium]